MSLLRSVTFLADGFTVNSTALGSITVTSANLSPAIIAAGPAAAEAFLNNQLQTKYLGGIFFKAYVYSLVPLVVRIYDSPQPIIEGGMVAR